MANERARNLRKSLTDAERTLWRQLRNKQLDEHRFRRQHPLGIYIVDFVCLEKKLVIEIDGSQHAGPEAVQKDSVRTIQLNEMGYEVIRFWNNDVLQNIDGVVLEIRQRLGAE